MLMHTSTHESAFTPAHAIGARRAFPSWFTPLRYAYLQDVQGPPARAVWERALEGVAALQGWTLDPIEDADLIASDFEPGDAPGSRQAACYGYDRRTLRSLAQVIQPVDDVEAPRAIDSAALLLPETLAILRDLRVLQLAELEFWARHQYPGDQPSDADLARILFGDRLDPWQQLDEARRVMALVCDLPTFATVTLQ